MSHKATPTQRCDLDILFLFLCLKIPSLFYLFLCTSNPAGPPVNSAESESIMFMLFYYYTYLDYVTVFLSGLASELLQCLLDMW